MELSQQLDEIDSRKKLEYNELLNSNLLQIDLNEFLNWRVKARHLLSMACGTHSQHFLEFLESEKPSMYSTSYESLKRVRAVFLAAKEDYESGYLKTVRNLVQAEVFENELEQATKLLSAGYHSPAAVIAGVVLETTLRQLCDTGRFHAESSIR